MNKQYNREYFDRWYRGRGRIHARDEVRRKALLAIATAEYFLRRPIETVLDVGAGEGAWLKSLRSIRRRVSYVGVEPSAYAVERFGRERNLRRGGFGDLGKLRLPGPFDLVVCSDVMHYLPQEEIARGIAPLARLTRGVAYLEVLTKEDDIIGDVEGLVRRPARWYRRQFEKAGLTSVAPYCWLSQSLRDTVSELEAR